MRSVFSCELRLFHPSAVDELIGGAGLYVMSNENVTCKIVILELGIEPRSEQCECSVLTAILFELRRAPDDNPAHFNRYININ